MNKFGKVLLLGCWLTVGGVGGSLATAQGLNEQPTPSEQPSMAEMLQTGPQGSILIRATQGTPDGGSLAGLPIDITIAHKNEQVKAITAVLADNGTTIVNDIPVGVEVRAIVWITYKDVQYQGVSPILNAANPNASVEVKVYEPTLQEPQWRVVTHQVGVARADDGVIVKEFVLVENASKETWLGGEPMRDDKGTTVTLRLPKDATDIELGQGFHGWCCTSLKDQLLHVQMPIMPGQKAFRFGYRIQGTVGEVDLSVAVPAATSELIMFMPDDGSDVQSTSLTPQGAEMINGTSLRKYRATGLAPDQQAGIRFAALLDSSPAGSRATTTAAGSTTIFLMIGGILLLAGATVILLRVPKKTIRLNV